MFFLKFNSVMDYWEYRFGLEWGVGGSVDFDSVMWRIRVVWVWLVWDKFMIGLVYCIFFEVDILGSFYFFCDN